MPKKEQPKKLLLADWSARNWPTDKITAVIEELTKLIDTGFSISMWQTGKLVSLTKNNLAILKDETIRAAMIPALPEEIRAANKQCNQDNSLILDDYWVSNSLAKYVAAFLKSLSPAQGVIGAFLMLYYLHQPV